MSRFIAGCIVMMAALSACGVTDDVYVGPPGSGSGDGETGGSGNGGSSSTGGGTAASGGGVGGNGDTGPDLPCDVQKVLSTNCTACHGSPLNNGAPFPLLTLSDLQAMSPSYPGQTVAQRCLARMNDTSNPMPPTFFSGPTNGADRTTLSNWINAGSPGATCTSTGTGGGTTQGTGGGTTQGTGGGTEATGGGTEATGGGTAATGGGGTSASGGGGTGGTGGGTGIDYTQCQNTALVCTDASGSGDYACLSTTTSTGFPTGAHTCTSDTDCPFDYACWSSGTTSKCLQSCGSSAMSGGTGGGSGSGGGSSSGGGSASGGGSSSGGGAGGGGSSSCGTDTWSNYGQSFFATTCDSCHQHTGQFSTQSAVTGSLSTIKSRISSGSMPQGGGLTSAEKTRILAYLTCGAP